MDWLKHERLVSPGCSLQSNQQSDSAITLVRKRMLQNFAIKRHHAFFLMVLEGRK